VRSCSSGGLDLRIGLSSLGKGSVPDERGNSVVISFMVVSIETVIDKCSCRCIWG